MLLRPRSRCGTWMANWSWHNSYKHCEPVEGHSTAPLPRLRCKRFATLRSYLHWKEQYVTSPKILTFVVTQQSRWRITIGNRPITCLSKHCRTPAEMSVFGAPSR